MWHNGTELWLKIHASGLGQDAVIEIMIALLGVMMAAMAILVVLVSLVFAGLGFFGYKAIEEKSIAAAEKAAIKAANRTNEKSFQEQLLAAQAVELSTSQPPSRREKDAATSGNVMGRKTSDSGLSRARKPK